MYFIHRFLKKNKINKLKQRVLKIKTKLLKDAFNTNNLYYIYVIFYNFTKTIII
jgi:hypothetical protein